MRADDVRQRREFYNELNFHADYEVCYELLKNGDFGFIHQVLTYTRQHPESGTTFATRYNTFRPGALAIFIRYGPYYLSKEEYKYFLRRRLKSYYRDLAKSVFGLRGKDFWQYHSKELQKIGYRISLIRLAAVSGGIAINLLLNPGSLIKYAFRRLRDKGGVPQAETQRTTFTREGNRGQREAAATAAKSADT
jgi:hypothetical protein